ncbi:MAG: nucleotidyltransferase domain-containing protein [Saprospiraceae bacterium]|nr:nucleotidyltransferase domain-containing protein [Saprospiraceae bacterium]
MTIQELKDQNLIIFETISGSHAYGLSLPTSDVDIRGVFVLPKADFYGLNYIPQVSDETNDTVYYELGRFIDLLSKNNPNILEMLNAPKDCIKIKHPYFDQLKPEDFLSKLCKDTFAGYAMTQVRKARGLNKKIMNPMHKTKKSVLDFCYVIKNQGSIPLRQWLKEENKLQENCGLVNIPHMHDVYGLYYDPNQEYEFKGIMRAKTVDTILLSSIPKGLTFDAIMSFNKDGYKKYCKDYKAYWEWVEERNEARYENTIQHGKNYDAKNMMHTFRLLDMAEEILHEGKIVVRRPNREYLLKIRSGAFLYDELIKEAQAKIECIEALYAECPLPDRPNLERINQLLVDLRTQFYQ